MSHHLHGEASPRLKRLLAEDSADADQRARTWLQSQAGEGPWILHGAGNLGRRVYAHLQAQGSQVLAVSDGNPANWGMTLGEHRVLSPAEALGKWGSEACTLVTVFNTGHAFKETQKTLQLLASRPVLPVQGYFWRFPEVFLPYYAFDLPSRLLAGRNQLLEVAALFSDDESRRQFEGHIAWRLLLDFHALPEAIPSTQYFDPALRPGTLQGLFVDCGAFDGDTLLEFLECYGPETPGMVAYEPDPANFSRLTAWTQTLPVDLRSKIDCRCSAVGVQDGWLHFTGDGGSGARVSQEGGLQVKVVRLDRDLQGQHVGWIKMDLEGQELEALEGSLALPHASTRTYTISMYHRTEDFWTIPGFLARHLPTHALHARSHGEDGFDFVCYAIPEASTR